MRTRCSRTGPTGQWANRSSTAEAGSGHSTSAVTPSPASTHPLDAGCSSGPDAPAPATPDHAAVAGALLLGDEVAATTSRAALMATIASATRIPEDVNRIIMGVPARGPSRLLEPLHVALAPIGA